MVWVRFNSTLTSLGQKSSCVAQTFKEGTGFLRNFSSNFAKILIQSHFSSCDSHGQYKYFFLH